MKSVDCTDDMNIIKVMRTLNALDEKHAISSEDIITKGIKLGLTEEWPRGKEDGHPWRPRISTMMGVGNESSVLNHESVILQRKKCGTNTLYWIDDLAKSHDTTPLRVRKNARLTDSAGKSVSRRSVSRTKKPNGDATGQTTTTFITLTQEQKEIKAQANPEKYILIGTHLLDRIWAENHPDKVDAYRAEEMQCIL